MSLFGDLMALQRGQRAAGLIRTVAPDVQLPFNPPLGTPLRYGFERRIERQAHVQSLNSSEELTWLASDDGYILRRTVRSTGFVGPEPLQGLMNGISAALIDQPLLVHVTHDGTDASLCDPDGWRKRSRTAIANAADQLSGSLADPTARDAMLGLAVGMVAQIEALTEAQFEASELQALRLLLCEAGPMPDGEEIVATVQLPAMVGEGLVQTDVSARLDVNPAGKWARMKLTSRADPVSAAAVWRPAVVAKLPAITDPAIRRQTEALLADGSNLEVKDELSQLFELPAGIARRSDYKRSITLPGAAPRLEAWRWRRLM